MKADSRNPFVCTETFKKFHQRCNVQTKKFPINLLKCESKFPKSNRTYWNFQKMIPTMKKHSNQKFPSKMKSLKVSK